MSLRTPAANNVACCTGQFCHGERRKRRPSSSAGGGGRGGISFPMLVLVCFCLFVCLFVFVGFVVAVVV